jgi:hypothetical protein
MSLLSGIARLGCCAYGRDFELGGLEQLKPWILTYLTSLGGALTTSCEHVLHELGVLDITSSMRRDLGGHHETSIQGLWCSIGYHH